MSKTLSDVAVDVMNEVDRAREMWGTTFDDKNTLNDWIAYTNIYLANASTMGASPETVKRGLRKAAGLVLSALYQAENDLLAPRHYDGALRPDSLPEVKV